MNLLKKLMETFFILTITFMILITACQNKTVKEEGWKNLFDGKTLNGWKVLNQDWENPDVNPEFYVKNNMIICNTTMHAGGGYLVTKKIYSNFILELDVKIDSSLNSGIQCRSHVWDRDTITTFVPGNALDTTLRLKWPAGYVWGYQIEIDPSNRAWSGGLYEPGNRGWMVALEGNKLAQEAFKKADWNHFRIVMNGNKIQTWVNGILAVDTTDEISASGFIGLQFHGASNESYRNKKTMWKNIKIREL